MRREPGNFLMASSAASRAAGTLPPEGGFDVAGDDSVAEGGTTGGLGQGANDDEPGVWNSGGRSCGGGRG